MKAYMRILNTSSFLISCEILSNRLCEPTHVGTTKQTRRQRGREKVPDKALVSHRSASE